MCSKLLSFLVSVLLCRNVLLCFGATVSALVCLVCSSTVVRNYDDDDDEFNFVTVNRYESDNGYIDNNNDNYWYDYDYDYT